MKKLKHPTSLAAAALVACTLACSSGSGGRGRTAAATPNAIASAATGATPDTARCNAAVRGEDVSSWRLVSAKQFTLCLPPDWQGRSGNAHHGRSTINWGTGRPPTHRIAVKSMVVVRAGQRPPPPELPPGSQTQQFAENIGGINATLYSNRFEGTYYVGATWDAVSVWVAGETTDSQGADLLLTIARTVRFTSK
jgi:hypothetical protein